MARMEASGVPSGSNCAFCAREQTPVNQKFSGRWSDGVHFLAFLLRWCFPTVEHPARTVSVPNPQHRDSSLCEGCPVEGDEQVDYG